MRSRLVQGRGARHTWPHLRPEPRGAQGEGRLPTVARPDVLVAQRILANVVQMPRVCARGWDAQAACNRHGIRHDAPLLPPVGAEEQVHGVVVHVEVFCQVLVDDSARVRAAVRELDLISLRLRKDRSVLLSCFLLAATIGEDAGRPDRDLMGTTNTGGPARTLCELRRCFASRAACVDLPARSSPSNTKRHPRLCAMADALPAGRRAPPRSLINLG